jgi:metallo-beta-lactamase class B
MNRYRWTATTVLTGVTTVLVGAATAQDRSSWTEPFEPFRIIGNIHYVGTAELAVFLITTPEGHILLEGAMPESVAMIEESIEKLGFDVTDVKYLLNSQAHVDHVGTLAGLARDSGADVLVMDGDADIVSKGGIGDYLFPDSQSFPPVEVDRVLHDGETVALGGTTLTARHTPGHTQGCTTWIMDVEEGGQRYRVVFPGSTTVNPGTRLVQDPSYPGIHEDFERTFEILEGLEPDVFLAAHASFFNLAAKRREQLAGAASNPFIDPEGYTRLTARKKKDFEAAVATEMGRGE